MLARVPWTPAVPATQKRTRINKDRRTHIVRAIASILAKGEPTYFAFEATCRHAVRSRLCLIGWSWSDADEMAAGIVKDSLKRIGAERPSWNQGQPEWAQEGFAPIERTLCVRCHGPLPEGHKKFCSNMCTQAHFGRVYRIRDAEDMAAYKLVVKSFTFWKSADAA